LNINNRFYFAIIIIASILIFILNNFYFRGHFIGYSHFYDLLFGSLPNFCAILGFSFIYPLFKGTISFKEHINATLFITLGVLAYEIEQHWTERTFDYLDIIASIIAAMISIILYKKVFIKSKITL